MIPKKPTLAKAGVGTGFREGSCAKHLAQAWFSIAAPVRHRAAVDTPPSGP